MAVRTFAKAARVRAMMGTTRSGLTCVRVAVEVGARVRRVSGTAARSTRFSNSG